jgi:hypothetical protein
MKQHAEMSKTRKRTWMIVAAIVGTIITILSVVSASFSNNQTIYTQKRVLPYEQIWHLDLGLGNAKVKSALHTLVFESDLYNVNFFV